MIIQSALFILGVVILWKGADWFIRGGRIIAENLGVSPLVVGLTLGAIGTSMPELIVSVMASVVGRNSMSIGNVVGSNIANIGLALGLGSLILPVPVEKDVLKYDYWVLLGSGVLFFIFLRNAHMGSVEGIVFLIFFLAYMVFIVTRHRYSEAGKEEGLKKKIGLEGVFLFILGAAGLVGGAKLVVNGASQIAAIWGLSDTVIGITVVAVGTSLPEIAVVVAGSIRKQPEISIGTIIGSNIINILLISGLVSVISPVHLNPSEIMIQAPVVVLFTILLLPVIKDGKITRFEGWGLFAAYVVYLFFVF